MDIQHSLPFDPTYGYTLEQLLAVPAPDAPVDYRQFWERVYADAMQIDLNVTQREIPSPDENFRLFEVEYDSYQGLRIGAWLTVPRGEPAYGCGAVVSHGYGGREEPGFGFPLSRGVTIQLCARGFHRSACPAVPDNAAEHVLHGIDAREQYSHLGCVVDHWLAASVLLSLYPEVRERLYFIGGSFGGGIGAMVLPWDGRFNKAYLNIPSFGNHPLRVTLPCTGSGAAVKARYDAGDQGILETLSYFDAATAAKHIRIPVLVAAALFDPSVPPPGQFAVYNALNHPKQLYLRQAAHFELSGNEHDDAAIHSRLLRWFAGE